MGQEEQAPADGAAMQKALKVNRIFYRGQTGALYGIWLTQMFLTILTLGIYHFWAKTNLRRYLFGAMELDGDRFEYLGTGKELFLGMLKIMPFYVLIVAMLGGVQYKYGEHGVVIAELFLLPLVFFLIPVAAYSGFRYRVNRTSWRGVRGVMRGSAFAFGGKFILGSLISFATLGIMIPSVDLKRWEYQVKYMNFGNVPFRFQGESGRLNGVNIVTLLLFPFTMGISRLWYNAALQREKMRGLSLGNLRFRLTATAGNYFGLALGNMFILLLTLYIGMPFVLQRNMRFFERHLAVGGEIQELTALQAAMGKAGDAEGLLDVLDVDMGVIGA